ncbi:sulfatase family protein [Dysgonomonas termitidis]|uniref:Sulfatase n=1 Tax=Dysgonomonas termitidis TaxID=1516126 RepID=A0ABV9KSU4_9BACT
MKNTALSIAGLALPVLCAPLIAQTGKPNIVVIMTDQQRADLCGREGFPLDVTPFVDRLAKEGVWFDKAYTVAPASSPARCSMLTGRFPSATHVRTNHNVPDIYFDKDLAGVLKENGYKTALVGKNHSYLKPSDLSFWSEYGHWGKNKKITPGDKETARFLNQEAKGQWLEPSPIPLEEQLPTKIVDETLTWIESQKDNPFFVWVSFPEPHNPYQVCEPYYSMFSPDKLPLLKTSRKDLEKKGEKYRILAQLEDESCPNLEKDLPRIRANYIGMIRLIDDQVKRLIESLKASGQFENTVFVILSDHGDYWGEYGLIRKGAGLSESLSRIPMVWAGYQIKRQIAPMVGHVSIADLFPTFCSVIGAQIPAGVQGRSLWPMLTGKTYPKEEFSSIVVQQGFGGANVPLDSSLTFEQEGALTPGKIAHFDELNTWTQSGTSRMIRKGDWKLVMDNYGKGELYNLKKDPSEIHNLFGDKKYSIVQTELLAGLVTWELRLQDPLPLPRKRYHFKQNPYNYLLSDLE